MTTSTNRTVFAALFKAKKRIEEELKTINDELTRIDEALTEEFIDEGMDSARVDGVTIYLERQLWAGRAPEATGGELAATLEELGLEQFLTVNSQTISSYVREVAKTATGQDHPSAEAALAALPKPLQSQLKVTEAIHVRGRRTG